MEIEEKKFLVVGTGISGIAAAELLVKKNLSVVLYDGNEDLKEQEIREKSPLLKDVEIVLGKLPEAKINSCDIAVLSPGVPTDSPMVNAMRETGLAIWGEIELAYAFEKGKVLAITGTNGKTTTTALLGEIMKNYYNHVQVVGNIGIPYTSVVDENTEDSVTVAEISSFQLETVNTFKPKAAAILNLTPDHLDRHGDMAGYLAAKAKIFAMQDENDYLVLNYDDEYLRPLAEQARAQVLFFSRRHILAQGVYVENGMVKVAWQNKVQDICQAADIMIKGAHNLENAMAAVALSLVMGVSVEKIAETLQTFSGVEHRLEPVRTVDGVLYINDSKGTNPDSTAKALESYDRPLVLIAGGKGKGVSFLPLAELIKQKVKAVVLVGMAKYELKEALDTVGFSNYVLVDDFAETVAQAQKMASVGDIVLLSPACTSWDMFSSYEERGELFKKLVNAL